MTRKSDAVAFEAAGKTWTVRLDARAWIEIEDETGQGLNEAAQAILDLGVRGFIEKPWNASRISRALAP